MKDDEILKIRDQHLPSQGEPFDCLAFGRAVAAAEREDILGVLEAQAMTARDCSSHEEATALFVAISSIHGRANHPA